MYRIYNSPTNYSGSKTKILPQLLEYFPKKEDVSTFYDIFTGGLSVSINTNYNKTISNDIIPALINFYKNLKKASDEDKIEEEIQKILSYKIDKIDKEKFLKYRKEFNIEKNDPYIFFTLICSSTNNLMRFNKKFEYNQTFGKRSINDNTVKKLIEYCNILKNKNITFTNHHYSNFFQLSNIQKEDFVYLDPPYGQTCAGYNSIWSKRDEEYLYSIIDSLDKNGIRFALSGVSIHKGIKNPFIDRLSKYKIINIDQSYEKVAKIKGLKSQEILVINY